MMLCNPENWRGMYVCMVGHRATEVLQPLHGMWLLVGLGAATYSGPQNRAGRESMFTATLQEEHLEELIMPERLDHRCFYSYYLFPAKYSLSITPGKVWDVLRESIPAPLHVAIILTLQKSFTGPQSQFTHMNKDHSLCLISRDSSVMDDSVVTKRMAVWELYYQWLKGSRRRL